MNKDVIIGFANFALCLSLAPLLPGIINKTKALFAGRQGPPLLQMYYDIIKLMGKSSVYSRTCGWVFRSAPMACLAALLCACAMLPGILRPANAAALFSFQGDIVLFIYLLALARFATVLGALDTGSSFEGMGASREVQFAVFAEPCLIFGLAALAMNSGSLSVSVMLSKTQTLPFAVALLLAAAFFAVSLSENCRVPFDDPNTHLELTMIHEVMVLDYSGPELGMIFYGASLKLWIFSALIVRLSIPFEINSMADACLFLAGMALSAVAVGVVESCIARFRFLKTPQILVGAFALALFAMMFSIVAGGSR